MEELKEVENYANRVCNLPEAKEAFSHGCEKESRQPRHEFKEFQLKPGRSSVRRLSSHLEKEGIEPLSFREQPSISSGARYSKHS